VAAEDKALVAGPEGRMPLKLSGKALSDGCRYS